MTRQSLILHTLDYLCNVAQVNGRAVRTAFHNYIAIALGGVDLRLRSQSERFVFAVELARAGIDCGGFYRSGELIEGYSARGELTGIHFNAHGALDPINVYLGYARQNVNALRHLGCAVAIKFAIR